MTKADALRHPNWTMGPKITVDCATLMNKGLEVIEAMRLYRLPLAQVSVVIHRQSIVHSLVEYSGRGRAGPAGYAGYATAHPLRHDLARSGAENPAEPLDLSELPAPDLCRSRTGRLSPASRLAEEAAEAGRHGLRHPERRQRGGRRVCSWRRRSAFMTFPTWWRRPGRPWRRCKHPRLEDILAADRAARRGRAGRI